MLDDCTHTMPPPTECQLPADIDQKLRSVMPKTKSKPPAKLKELRRRLDGVRR